VGIGILLSARRRSSPSLASRETLANRPGTL